jgi:hypothetical protein
MSAFWVSAAFMAFSALFAWLIRVHEHIEDGAQERGSESWISYASQGFRLLAKLPAVAIIFVIVIFLAAVAWATVNMGRESVQSLLLTWNVKGPDRVTAEFEVRNPTSEPAICVLRAQDSKRTDLGYATITVPPGTDYVRVPYELRTLAPAYVVEILGCSLPGGTPNAIPPQFPPGVVPPSQPWTPPQS